MSGYYFPYKVEGFFSSLTGTLRIYAIQKSKSNFFQRRFVSGNRKTVLPNTGTFRQLTTSRCSSETRYKPVPYCGGPAVTSYTRQSPGFSSVAAYRDLQQKCWDFQKGSQVEIKAHENIRRKKGNDKRKNLWQLMKNTVSPATRQSGRIQTEAPKIRWWEDEEQNSNHKISRLCLRQSKAKHWGEWALYY